MLWPHCQSKEKDVKDHGLLAAGDPSTGIMVPCFPHLQRVSVSPTTPRAVRAGDDPGTGLCVAHGKQGCCGVTARVCADRHTHAGGLEKVLEESPSLYNVSSDRVLGWKRKVPLLLYILHQVTAGIFS